MIVLASLLSLRSMEPQQTYNGKSSSYLLLFVPSALEIVIVVTLTGLILLLPQIPLVSDYLQQNGNFDIFHWAARTLDHILTSLIGGSRVDVLVVAAFWAIVGLVVYAFLRGLARFISELDDDVVMRHYVWPKGMDRSRPLHVMLKRTFFRLVALIVLVIMLTGPLDAVIHGPVLVNFLGSNLVVQYLAWAVISLLVLHAATILLRLVALRGRLLN